MLRLVRRFLRRDDGAISVDWVVLCATAVAMTVLIAGQMRDGTLNLTDGMAQYMGDWDFE